MITPNYSRWDQPVTTYKNPEMFLRWSGFQSGIHSINCGGTPLDLLLSRKRSDTLLVVFNGHVHREKGTPPFFSGLHIASNQETSLLCLNDPAIYLDSEINMAWYAGTSNIALQKLIPDIIDKVATSTARRMIMLGGSAGGFAALYYALKVRTPTIAVVFNSQTNINKYLQKHVKHFYQVCYGVSGNYDDPPYSYSCKVDYDLCSLYANSQRPPVIYMQNVSDWHAKGHADPFIKNYGISWNGYNQSADGIFLHVGNWGDGHVSPPKELIDRLLSKLCAWETDWHEVLNQMPSFFAF